MDLTRITTQQILNNFNQFYDKNYQGLVSRLCISENATYKVVTSKGEKYVLRIHRPNYHNLNKINSELAWLLALKEQDINVPTPIKGINKEFVQTFSIEGHNIYVVLFNWISGSEPNLNEDLKQSFRRLGKMNAKLHEHTKHWTRPDYFERPIWNHENMLGENGYWGHWREGYLLDSNDYSIINETIKLIRYNLKVYGQEPDKFGLIHADLRLANLLIDGNSTSVIDFDDCGLGWYLHDLASAISFHEHLPTKDIWVNEWLNGYHEECTLTQVDLSLIDTFIMQRRLQLLAWTGSHSQTQTTRNLGKEWVPETINMCKTYLN